MRGMTMGRSVVGKHPISVGCMNNLPPFGRKKKGKETETNCRVY